MTQANDKGKLDAERLIARYLINHPDFFERRTEVLDKLRIPHTCGPAVSLLERQAQRLREQNQQLRDKLQELVKIARENDCLSKRMQNLNMVLIEARQLDDMLQGVREVLRDEFNADFTALRLATAMTQPGLTEQDRLPPSALELFKPLLRSGRPLCGKLVAEQAGWLFQDTAEQVASAALVPLGSDADWYGILAIGSRDDQRFHAGMGILFLNRIGELLNHALNTQLYSAGSTAP